VSETTLKDIHSLLISMRDAQEHNAKTQAASVSKQLAEIRAELREAKADLSTTKQEGRAHYLRLETRLNEIRNEYTQELSKQKTDLRLHIIDCAGEDTATNGTNGTGT